MAAKFDGELLPPVELVPLVVELVVLLLLSVELVVEEVKLLRVIGLLPILAGSVDGSTNIRMTSSEAVQRVEE